MASGCTLPFLCPIIIPIALPPPPLQPVLLCVVSSLTLTLLDSDTKGAGVWGTSGMSSEVTDGGVGDEDLQAQGWLPVCLTVLLSQV